MSTSGAESSSLSKKTFSPQTFSVAQLNAENLFLFMDERKERDWRALSEREWQSLSSASLPNKSLVKTLWLADSLLQINPDLVFMNEVGGLESLQNFAQFFLNDTYDAHLIEGNSDRGIDVGFLLKKSLDLKADLRTHKNRPLNFLYPHEVQSNLYFQQAQPEKVIKSHYFSRDCAELRLFTQANLEKPFLIGLCVHLKSKLDPDGIDAGGARRRQAEAETLVQIYKELKQEFATSPVPILIGGDFNGTVAKGFVVEEFKCLEDSDLEATTDVAGLELEQASTQVQINRNNQTTHMQIDYLLMSPELKPKLIKESVQVFRYRGDLGVPLPMPTTFEQRTYLPSDHFPIVATFKDLY